MSTDAVRKSHEAYLEEKKRCMELETRNARLLKNLQNQLVTSAILQRLYDNLLKDYERLTKYKCNQRK